MVFEPVESPEHSVLGYQLTKLGWCVMEQHNTFNQLYLKDLALSDDEKNMYLGSVVAVQQVGDIFFPKPS